MPVITKSNSWGDVDEDGYEEDAEFAARHEGVIRQRMIDYNAIDENNMADYQRKSHSTVPWLVNR